MAWLKTLKGSSAQILLPVDLKSLSYTPSLDTRQGSWTQDEPLYWYLNDPIKIPSNCIARATIYHQGHYATYIQISTDNITWTTIMTSPYASSNGNTNFEYSLASYKNKKVYFRIMMTGKVISTQISINPQMTFLQLDSTGPSLITDSFWSQRPTARTRNYGTIRKIGTLSGTIHVTFGTSNFNANTWNSCYFTVNGVNYKLGQYFVGATGWQSQANFNIHDIPVSIGDSLSLTVNLPSDFYYADQYYTVNLTIS